MPVGLGIQAVMFAFIVALIPFIAAQAQPGPIKSCGGSNFVLEMIKFEPYPIAIGRNLFVTTVGTLNTTITEGSTTEIVLKLGAIPVFKESKDFCKQSADAGYPCPLVPGLQDIVVTQEVPAYAPAGRFNVEVKVVSADKVVIGCFGGPVQLEKK